jgi:Putative transposase
LIVPGGGLSLDGTRWVSSRSNFLVHVNVLTRLFRGKMLAMLMDAHGAGQLKFFNTQAGLADKGAFKRFIAPLRHIKWVVYCKAPFAGPKQVLRYLSRYTHRVAISNRRLIAADDAGVAFRWKDYRADGPARLLPGRPLMCRFLDAGMAADAGQDRHVMSQNGGREAGLGPQAGSSVSDADPPSPGSTFPSWRPRPRPPRLWSMGRLRQRSQAQL